jgi:tetratricopeptide (TPR) repeat protein
VTGARAPAWLATLREMASQFPGRPQTEHALWRLGSWYEDAKQYDEAARAYSKLGAAFPRTAYDAWFRAGDVLEKQLRRPAEARQAFLSVPAGSRRYAEAQRRAAKLQ